MPQKSVGVLSESEIAVARARIAAGNRATEARIEPSWRNRAIKARIAAGKSAEA